MVTLATPMYSPAGEQDQEDPYTTLFCRALYDYEAQDASALSFHRNDIIEVLTKQPSGWWDGLLGDERGWFPSNYVTVISDEEAELAFSGSEISNTDDTTTETQIDNSLVDMSHAMLRGAQSESEDWSDGETAYRNGLPGLTTIVRTNSQPSDFWVPQVAPNGQIYYVNTQTGQHSRDLPQEHDDDVSDSDLAGLTSQSSSRSGTTAGLGLAQNGTPNLSHSEREAAGLGVPRRSGTPEPWVRRLADDGMSHYYYHKVNGQVQWIRPGVEPRPLPDTSQRPTNLSPQTSRQQNRLSVYSDDSDIEPLNPLVAPRATRPNGRVLRSPDKAPDKTLPPELTSAERIAESLRRMLLPSPPEAVADLSNVARRAIQAVVDNIQFKEMSRRLDDDRKMDDLIAAVVLAARNLLYVSAAPSSQIPGGNASPQSPLKPAQRKVTATLSRLVLSARAMEYDSGSSVTDTLNRIQVDAVELERAIMSFVAEYQRLHINSASTYRRRLHGALVGAGAAVPQIRLHGQKLIAEIGALLSFVADIHIARHVDIDGLQDGAPTTNSRYQPTVEKARLLVRTLEAVMQSLHDDNMSLLLYIQSVHNPHPAPPEYTRTATHNNIETLSLSLRANLGVMQQVLEDLLVVGDEQADVAQGDYHNSIDWRMSHSTIGKLRHSDERDPAGNDDAGDTIGMEHAMGPISTKPKMDNFQHHMPNDSFASVTQSTHTRSSDYTIATDETVTDETIIGRDSLDNIDDGVIGEALCIGFHVIVAESLKKMLGDDYQPKPPTPPPDVQPPWYLCPNYNPADILIEVPALVERLTAHDQGDPTFVKSFLMTFKSFTTVDELFQLLVERFRIQPPPQLTPSEHEQWGKLKRHVIQTRVINIFKSLVEDDDVLEKDDMHILGPILKFISEEVPASPTTRALKLRIERALSGDIVKTMVSANLGPPPPPILPRTKKLRLLDIDPIELARQLTLFESQLYQKIRPMECLQRAREQRTENTDNITTVIQTSNRIANWVAESVLERDDSRRRASAVKHLISVADRCRALNNFSTMIAITSGLNTPPIRRLKRTWEQVNHRYMAQFSACEMTIDSNKNFTKYRQLMASVTPPCVPFIGVFLSTLQFIQDGNPDNLPGNLVNFRKRQKASEVISDIKRWQAQSFNFHPVPSIIAYIDESLNQFNSDTKASSEHFWLLSLEREPREREDEKMARLLQESGFL
ncbi:ras guanine nucleotide exchange factor domain-containing protein [Infundibulicybe gibba]|nr:ras guanine nucleotide exchange factor domain-containing protein [Infundibulicybe gibba]